MTSTEHMTLDGIESWLLSGVPVVRLWGRDFDQPVSEYVSWLRGLETNLGLPLAILETQDVPGVVVQAYIGKEPELKDPLLKPSKTKTPWLYCVEKGCRNRTKPGTQLGGTCEVH